MKKFLQQLDNDIKRIELILKENNYIEIVIAVEEFVDKYKSNIEDLGVEIDKDRVWNYSKKDLEDLKEKLIKYRNDNIGELMFNSVRQYLSTESGIPSHTLDEAKEVLDNIENIYNEKSKKEEKWNKLKQYLVWLSNQDMKIATMGINIINVMLQIEY